MFKVEFLAFKLINKGRTQRIYDFKVEHLFGDASDRQYFRVSFGDETAVMMKVDNVKSGEFGRGDSLANFITLTKMFQDNGLDTPKILAVIEEQKALLLEDLGDSSMFAMIKSYPTKKLHYVKSAVEFLVKMQQAMDKRTVFNSPADKRLFSKSLFMEEFYHFYEYMIQKRVYNRSFKGLWKKLEKEFKEISDELVRLPYVLSHRDFQSKNIMIRDNRQYLIDFQDALMAPAVYDLAALLRDSYIILEEREIDMLLDYFWSINSVVRELLIDYESFKRAFHLQALQRKMKDAGRFIYLNQVKGKEQFLPYVVPTLGHIKKTLIRLEKEKMADKLAMFIYELKLGGRK